MKKFGFGLAVALFSLLMTSCDLFGGKDKVKIDPEQLVGRWEAPSQAKNALEGAKLVFVFQADSCIVDGGEYGCWGYQIDLGDEEAEEGLTNEEVFAQAERYMFDDSEEGTYHRNGWFGWMVDNNSTIRLWNMTSVGSAKTPVANDVTSFSPSKMTMIDGGKTYTFTKVVQ